MYLIKWPVCVCVCVYIYIYIYMQTIQKCCLFCEQSFFYLLEIHIYILEYTFSYVSLLNKSINFFQNKKPANPRFVINTK